MNKAITDGIDFMPPAFSDGLAVWSNQDGTPGSTTYDSVVTAAIVPNDTDFGACLEFQKSDAVQKIRYTGQTTVLPGCYLRVSARVKVVSGNMPDVRVAAWAGDQAGQHVAGLDELGPKTTLTAYGNVVEISAIIGSGDRPGNDMIWGTKASYGHIGLNFTGANGGVIRVENIRIEDATSVYHRNLMDWVDVRDYGAIGDGVTDNVAAFEAANVAAGKGTVLVSKGTYYLGSSFTFDAKVRFEGTVKMDTSGRLSLMQNYDLPTYIEAFGDEELGFRKALQALFNYTDHESLDMCGRRVTLKEPLNVQSVVDNKDNYANRRAIRNGQLESDGSASWDTTVVTSVANYSSAAPNTLTNVANIGAIPVGSLVEGTGVGREVYVRSKNVSAGTIELSLPLYGAPAQQTYTFSRFKYLLEFHDFVFLQRLILDDIEFLCQDKCSGILLPDDGLGLKIRDCFFTAPRDRAITSSGKGCAGMMLDRNQFMSSEINANVATRHTIAFNVNCNDVKIRDNRAVRFKHFGVIAGTGHMIQQNHFYQGDTALTDQRTAGIILTESNCKSIISGNYIDNCSIDWTNEHDADPSNNGELSFGGLTIDHNIFFAISPPAWFRFLRIKPMGAGHYINGLNVSKNAFQVSGGGSIQRVEEVDTSVATLNRSGFRNIVVEGNTYNSVTERMYNPAIVPVEYIAASATWQADVASYLPFGGKARRVVAVMAHNHIANNAGGKVYTMPYAVSELGANGTEIKLHWSEQVSGKVYATVRADNPV